MRCATLLYKRVHVSGSRYRLWIRASATSRTWQTVHSGFFPPQLLAHFCQEQVADVRENQMALEAKPATPLPMIESHLSFAVFKAALDRPPAERHAQHLLGRRFRRSVAQKVFDLIGERMETDKQVIRAIRQSLFVLNVDQHVLDAPDQRPFVGVLDPPGLPRLSGECRMRLGQILDRLRRTATSKQAWDFPPPALSPPKRPLCHPRRLDPHPKIRGNFCDKLLLPRFQGPQERWLVAIPFVKRQPIEVHAVGHGPVIHFHSDLSFGAVDHFLGNARPTTTRTIGTPALRQIQIAIEQTVEISRYIAQVDGDNAVLLLAHRSTVLSLHAWRLVSFFDPPGLVDDADRFVIGVLLGDDARHALAHPVLIPLQTCQEFLQRSHRHTCRQRHRFHALARQLRKLPSHIHGKMQLRIPPAKAIAKPLQVSRQPWLQLTNPLNIHALASAIPCYGHSFV